MFALATRKKFRFQSTRGPLTVEDLWDLPLSAKTGFDLDSVAREVNRELREITEDSFVETKPNPRKEDLLVMLEVAKAVIAQKQEDNAKARAAVERAEKRSKILDALRTKENQELTEASKEDLLKQLAELDA